MAPRQCVGSRARFFIDSVLRLGSSRRAAAVRTTSGLRWLVPLLAWSVTGCYEGSGGVAGPDDGSGGSDSGDVDTDDGESGGVETGGEEPTGPGSVDVSPVPLQHLTVNQYEATVRDLWPGAPTGISGAFSYTDPHTGETRELGPLDDDEFAFGFEMGTSMSTFLPERYFYRAEALATLLVEDLDVVLSCEPSRDCAQNFARTFGLRAYRRPLDDEQLGELMAVYDDIAAEYDFTGGIEAMAFAMLSSPHFLYRIERVPDDAPSGTAVWADDYEVATRLSYFLTGSMPDLELFAAAEAGELSSQEQVRAQAERLLGSERGHVAVTGFLRQWANLQAVGALEKNRDEFPDFDPSLGPALRRSLEASFAALAADSEASIGDLFTDPRMFVDDQLASFYGVSGVFSDEMQPAPQTQRSGVIGHPGVLAVNSVNEETQLVKRGLFVRKRLLCGEIPLPPEDAMLDLPPVDEQDPPENMRERFERHVKNPSCAACHAFIDPLGFAFESFDGLGRYRTDDVYGPVDPSGELLGTGEADGPYADFNAFMERLSGSELARGCVAEKMLEVALSRPVIRDSDIAELESIWTRAAEADWNLRTLALDLTTTESFRSKYVP